MELADILADDKLFDRLLCLIVVGGCIITLIVRSIRGDDDLGM